MKKQPRDYDSMQQARQAKLGRKSIRFPSVSRQRRRGASTLEFAVVAPVFFMLIFGMFEFGRMLMVQQVLTNGARSGSRVAVIDGATSSEVVSTVEEYLEGGSIDESDVKITVTPSNLAQTDTGEAITVELSVPFEDVSWLPSPWFLEDKTLTAQSTMRRE
jgi:Flp pilus assembly protein TadG